MLKLVRATKAFASRTAAIRNFEPDPHDDEGREGRMVLALSICLVISLLIVAIADEIERRSFVCERKGDSVDTVLEKIAVEENRSPQQNTIPPVATPTNNAEQSLQELDELVNDIVNSSARASQKEVSESTRQFDEMMKYDKFLKLLKS